MDLGLRGRKALVMGASRGLGRGIALALAREGCEVVMAARSEAPLAEAVREAEALGASARAQRLDLFDPQSVEDCLAAVEEGGGVDILVNNSGGPPPSGALGVPVAEWQRQFQAMVLSLMTATERLLPPMRRQGWGRILTVASAGVQQPIPTLGMSNTLRSGLVAWLKTLAGEVAADGVTVNVLLPGRIATDRTRQIDEAAATARGAAVDEVRRQSEALIPAGRYGRVEEFADVAAFLASERASYVTGSMVRVDGGLVRAP